jgi:hypothetical protein
MSHVKLKSTDLEIIIEITQLVCDYKIQALNKISWSKFQSEYLPKLVSQIYANEFKCNDINNNSLTWLIDQIVWSRKIVSGVSHKEGIPLSDTPLGEQALNILRAASKGQAGYDSWSRPTTFNKLFE